MINCITREFRSYGFQASKVFLCLEQIKRKNIQYPEKFRERLQDGVNFLSAAIIPDEHLKPHIYFTYKEFEACRAALLRARQVEVSAPTEASLEQTREILKEHLDSLNQIVVQFEKGEIEQVDEAKLASLQKFCEELLASENARESEFREQHKGNPFLNLMISAGKLA